MEGSERKAIQEIGSLYGLQVDFVEQYGKAFKLYTDKGEFALKRMNAKRGLDFFYYIQQLYQQGFNRIVPIYPAQDGRYGILHGNFVYYLMPWLKHEEAQPSQKYFDLFRELARLHSISVREVTISKEERKEHYETMRARWERERDSLEEFLEKCEREVYMSPFQLYFCTIYSEIAGGQRFALQKLKEWYDTTQDVEKSRSVIIHGKLSGDHFFYDDKGYGYFSNFEKAMIASPLHDLLPFLDRMFHTHLRQFDQSIEWLETYFRYFPLNSEEILLFQSYLAHPGPIYRVIKDYFLQQEEHKELEWIRRLQRQYWRMKNTEYVVMRIEEKERRKKEEADSSPSSAE